MWKNWWNKLIRWTDYVSGSRKLRMHSTSMYTEQNSRRSVQKDVPVHRSNRKVFQTLGKRFFRLSENENRHSMVLRHGGARTKMRRNVPWLGKPKHRAIRKVSTQCMDDHQFVRGRAVNSVIIVNMLLSTCHEMPVFGSASADQIFCGL